MESNQEINNNPLLDKFLEGVKSNPEKTAIVYQHEKLTYKELEETLFKLATKLGHQYPEIFASAQDRPVFIGILCKNKLVALCCEFAILALGATFVPFNLTDAPERQQFMLEKSGISLLLTDENAHTMHDSLSHFSIHSLYKIQNFPTADPDISTRSAFNDLAYVLFTSGSTAKNPKGVMRSGKGLLNQMTRDYKNDLAITENDVLLNLAIFSHDQAIVDCFAALLNGCTLCLYDPQNMNIADLHQFMIENKVTVFSSIPSLFSIIFTPVNKSTFPDLRVVTLGGEETRLSHARLYQEKCPDTCRLINGYGATELSWISSYEINHQTRLDAMQTIPLGFQTKFSKLKLLPIEGSALSELCIASDALSLGYLKDPEATAQAFIHAHDETWYRTGDLVKLNATGAIIYEGRQFWHEKISGKRVDIREVEAALEVHFRELLVLAWGEGDKRKLYAFYTDVIKDKNLEKIQEALKKTLEKHMLPQWVALKQLPVLPNGKINRMALCKILEEKENTFRQNLEKIRLLQQSPNIGEAIEGFWRETLDIAFNQELSEEDNFQSLGGTSQLAIQLTNKINQYFIEKHDLAITIDPFVLYKTGNHISALKNYSIHLHQQTTIKTTAQYPSPRTREYEVALVDFNFVGQNYRGYYCTNGDKIKAIEYDGIGLQIISDYFYKWHNIRITLCKSHEDIVSTIKDYANNRTCPNQAGIIFFIENNANAHPVPAVLCKNERNKVVMLIADGLQGFYCLGRVLSQIASIKAEFPDMDIRFDLTGRQIDSNSCSTDVVLYLLAALPINMLEQSTLLKDTLQTAYHAGPEKFFQRGMEFIPDTIAPCLLFISPIETYYHSNVDNIPAVFNIAPSTEMASLIFQFEDRDAYADSHELCFFQGWGCGSKTYQACCNTTLWKKSYEFQGIIDVVMRNQSHDEVRVENAAEKASPPVLSWKAALISLINEHIHLVKNENDFRFFEADHDSNKQNKAAIALVQGLEGNTQELITNRDNYLAALCNGEPGNTIRAYLKKPGLENVDTLTKLVDSIITDCSSAFLNITFY